jgi:hypothetical protein
MLRDDRFVDGLEDDGNVDLAHVDEHVTICGGPTAEVILDGLGFGCAGDDAVVELKPVALGGRSQECVVVAAEGVAGVDEDPVQLVDPAAGSVCVFGEELAEVDLPWELEDGVHLPQAVEGVVVLKAPQVKVQDAWKLQKLNGFFCIVFACARVVSVVTLQKLLLNVIQERGTQAPTIPDRQR